MSVFEPDDSPRRKLAKVAFLVVAGLITICLLYGLHLFMKWWIAEYWSPFFERQPFWVSVVFVTSFMTITVWYLWWSYRRYR